MRRALWCLVIAGLTLSAVVTTTAATPSPTDAEPASSPDPAVSDGAEDGLFRLTVVTPSAVIEVGDAIPITVMLAYVGPATDLAVRYPGDQVVQYRIERLDGGFTAETNPGPECGEATVTEGEVRAVTFGQADPGSPDTSVWSRWVDDTLVGLDPGTYRFTATTGYALFGCDPRRSLSASIVFQVIARDLPPDASPEPVLIPTGLPAATGEPSVCLTAELEGYLLADGRWGVAVGASLTGRTVKVIWPAGWSAQRDESGLALMDADGAIVAHEGDHIRIGGGEDAAGDWRTCADADLVVLVD